MPHPPSRAATRARAQARRRKRKTTAPCRIARTPRAQPARGVGSQTGRMVQECPRQLEPVAEMPGQRLDTHRLGGVVPRVEDVQLELFGVKNVWWGPSPVTTLSR